MDSRGHMFLSLALRSLALGVVHRPQVSWSCIERPGLVLKCPGLVLEGPGLVLKCPELEFL